MKGKKWMFLAALATLMVTVPVSAAEFDVEQERSDFSKMLHKLGRGATNVFTCWVEIPRNVANEWEKTDPATGIVMGTIKGFGWGFARLVTGVYEAVTFPIPIPAGYEPMLQPEFVVTDVWGDPIPDLGVSTSNDPTASDSTQIHPQQFRF